MIPSVFSMSLALLIMYVGSKMTPVQKLIANFLTLVLFLLPLIIWLHHLGGFALLGEMLKNEFQGIWGLICLFYSVSYGSLFTS